MWHQVGHRLGLFAHDVEGRVSDQQMVSVWKKSFWQLLEPFMSGAVAGNEDVTVGIGSRNHITV